MSHVHLYVLTSSLTSSLNQISVCPHILIPIKTSTHHFTLFTFSVSLKSVSILLTALPFHDFTCSILARYLLDTCSTLARYLLDTCSFTLFLFKSISDNDVWWRTTYGPVNASGGQKKKRTDGAKQKGDRKAWFKSQDKVSATNLSEIGI